MLSQTPLDDYDVRLEKVFQKCFAFLDALKTHYKLEGHIVNAIEKFQKEIETEIYRGS